MQHVDSFSQVYIGNVFHEETANEHEDDQHRDAPMEQSGQTAILPRGVTPGHTLIMGLAGKKSIASIAI